METQQRSEIHTLICSLDNNHTSRRWSGNTGRKDNMNWELVIIWASGEKEVVEYDSRQRATQGGRNYEMAFGAQVSWWCVREKR